MNYCEGRRTNRDAKPECKFTKYNKNGKCPCVQCIIKVSCSTECHPFTEMRSLMRSSEIRYGFMGDIIRYLDAKDYYQTPTYKYYKQEKV